MDAAALAQMKKEMQDVMTKTTLNSLESEYKTIMKGAFDKFYHHFKVKELEVEQQLLMTTVATMENISYFKKLDPEHHEVLVGYIEKTDEKYKVLLRKHMDDIKDMIEKKITELSAEIKGGGSKKKSRGLVRRK